MHVTLDPSARTNRTQTNSHRRNQREQHNYNDPGPFTPQKCESLRRTSLIDTGDPKIGADSEITQNREGKPGVLQHV